MTPHLLQVFQGGEHLNKIGHNNVVNEHPSASCDFCQEVESGDHVIIRTKSLFQDLKETGSQNLDQLYSVISSYLCLLIYIIHRPFCWTLGGGNAPVAYVCGRKPKKKKVRCCLFFIIYMIKVKLKEVRLPVL